MCGQSFQTNIDNLSKPVDVYTDWFDAIEQVNENSHSNSNGDLNEGANDDELENIDSNQGRGGIVDDDDDDEEDNDYSD